MVREGDTVVTRWTVSGSHQGAILDTPATGMRVTVAGVTWSVFAGEQVVLDWLTWDVDDMLRVLGIVSIGRLGR